MRIEIKPGHKYVSLNGRSWKDGEADDTGHWWLMDEQTGERARFMPDGRSWSAPGSEDDIACCYAEPMWQRWSESLQRWTYVEPKYLERYRAKGTKLRPLYASSAEETGEVERAAFEITEEMIVAGCEVANPLGGFAGWDAAQMTPREDVTAIYRAMAKAAGVQAEEPVVWQIEYANGHFSPAVFSEEEANRHIAIFGSRGGYEIKGKRPLYAGPVVPS